MISVHGEQAKVYTNLAPWQLNLGDLPREKLQHMHMHANSNFSLIATTLIEILFLQFFCTHLTQP